MENEIKSNPIEAHLKRLFILGWIYLGIISGVCLIWGWQSFLSALTGGIILILATSATSSAVGGVALEDHTKICRQIWFRLGWRLLLLALCLYAMLQAPWVRLEPLTAGLSLIFPVLVTDLFISGSGKKTEKTNTEQQK